MPIDRPGHPTPRFLGGLVVAAVTLVLGLAPGCSSDADEPATDTADAGQEANGGSVEAWCSKMLTQKALLREQYAQVFASAPDGDSTPSSALLSLDGSPAAVESLQAYVVSLGEGEPAEIAGTSEALAGELDELLAEVAAKPDQPGQAFVGGLGAMAGFSVLDTFAVDNCGESF